jgi:hypothetical protein
VDLSDIVYMNAEVIAMPLANGLPPDMHSLEMTLFVWFLQENLLSVTIRIVDIKGWADLWCMLPSAIQHVKATAISGKAKAPGTTGYRTLRYVTEDAYEILQEMQLRISLRRSANRYKCLEDKTVEGRQWPQQWDKIWDVPNSPGGGSSNNNGVNAPDLARPMSLDSLVPDASKWLNANARTAFEEGVMDMLQDPCTDVGHVMSEFMNSFDRIVQVAISECTSGSISHSLRGKKSMRNMEALREQIVQHMRSFVDDMVAFLTMEITEYIDTLASSTGMQMNSSAATPGEGARSSTSGGKVEALRSLIEQHSQQVLLAKKLKDGKINEQEHDRLLGMLHAHHVLMTKNDAVRQQLARAHEEQHVLVAEMKEGNISEKEYQFLLSMQLKHDVMVTDLQRSESPTSRSSSTASVGAAVGHMEEAGGGSRGNSGKLGSRNNSSKLEGQSSTSRSSSTASVGAAAGLIEEVAARLSPTASRPETSPAKEVGEETGGVEVEEEESKEGAEVESKEFKGKGEGAGVGGAEAEQTELAADEKPNETPEEEAEASMIRRSISFEQLETAMQRIVVSVLQKKGVAQKLWRCLSLLYDEEDNAYIDKASVIRVMGGEHAAMLLGTPSMMLDRVDWKRTAKLVRQMNSVVTSPSTDSHPAPPPPPPHPRDPSFTAQHAGLAQGSGIGTIESAPDPSELIATLKQVRRCTSMQCTAYQCSAPHTNAVHRTPMQCTSHQCSAPHTNAVHRIPMQCTAHQCITDTAVSLAS